MTSRKCKKIIAVVICLTLLFSLQGCARSTHGNEGVQPEETAGTERENSDMKTITLSVNDHILTAELESNSSAEALIEMLEDGPLSIKMSDYGNMEKVGDIGADLPTNDKQTKTKAGDLILYMGNQFVIYYAPNSWNFTRLGKVQDVTAAELKTILGGGDVTVTLSLPE